MYKTSRTDPFFLLHVFHASVYFALLCAVPVTGKLFYTVIIKIWFYILPVLFLLFITVHFIVHLRMVVLTCVIFIYSVHVTQLPVYEFISFIASHAKDLKNKPLSFWSVFASFCLASICLSFFKSSLSLH